MPRSRRERKGKGPAPRVFEDSVIAEMVAIRIREQVPWKQLPERYLEVVRRDVPDSSETAPDWRILQTAMMSDIDAVILPTRVHKKMRIRMEQEFDKADLGVMLMSVLQSRYGEWNLLHGKMLHHLVAAGVAATDGDEILTSVPSFTSGDRERMDMLAGEVVSIVFRMGDFMRTMHIEDNSLFQLVADVGGSSLSPQPQGVVTGESVSAAIERMSAQVGDQSVQMLQAINERHREVGVGHYRERPVVPDLLEEEVG